MRGYEDWNSHNTPPSIPDSPRFDRRDLLGNDMSSDKFLEARDMAEDVMRAALDRRSIIPKYAPGGVINGIRAFNGESREFSQLLKIFNLPADAEEIDVVQAAGTFLYGNVLIAKNKSLELTRTHLAAALDAACKWLKQEIVEPYDPRSISAFSRGPSGDPRTFKKLLVNLGTALVPDQGKSLGFGDYEFSKTPVSMPGLVKILGAAEVARIFTANGLPVPTAAQNTEEADEYGDHNPDDTIEETRESLGLGPDDDVIDAKWIPR